MLARAMACSSCGSTLDGTTCEACWLDHTVITPQPGPQSAFLASLATVVIYGGAAGGGKTFCLLIDALARALSTTHWSGLIARSQRERMTDGGGAIWAEAKRVFAGSGATYNEAKLEVRWPNGSVLIFRQIMHNTGLWNGPSFDWIGIEELQEVEIDDLIGALTRLRSAKGASPRLAATCNPKRGHGLVPWIRWYLLESGRPDRERSGVVRWMCRSTKTDEFVFADTQAEVEQLAGARPGSAKSFSYIAARLEDNPALDRADPNYRANLELGTREERERLLEGNWFAGGDDDGPLARGRWEFVTAPLSPIVKWCRAWDKAATRPHPKVPDPDYTAGGLVGFDAAGRLYFAGLAACREEPPLPDMLMVRTAEADGHMVQQIHKRGPSDTGKADAVQTRALLDVAGAMVTTVHERVAKEQRIRALVLAAERGIWKGAPVSEHNGPPPGVEPEPRLYVLDGPRQDGWPASYRQGWLREPYHDAGSHPATLGDLVWEHLDPWPRGKHDEVPDILADALEFGNAPPSRRAPPGRRAAALARR